MKLSPVQSSNISHIGHDAARGQMMIQFARGGTRYVYDNVTAEHYAALIGDGTGIGSRFHSDFKLQSEQHPYSRYDETLHGPVEIEGEVS